MNCEIALNESGKLSTTKTDNPISWLIVFTLFWQKAVLKQIRIFWCILIRFSQYRNCPKATFTEKKLCWKICFTNLNQNTRAPLCRQLVGQLAHHLRTNTLSAHLWRRCKIEHLNLSSTQLINHEPNNLVIVLGYHANTVSLAKTINKIVFQPRKLGACCFYGQNFGHIMADHPPNMHFYSLSLIFTHSYLLTFFLFRFQTD